MEKPWEKQEPKPWEKKEILGGPVDPKTSGDPVLKGIVKGGDERPPAQGLTKAADESYDKVMEAMAGRLESDIPLDDVYWTIKNQEVMKWNIAKDKAVEALRTSDLNLRADNTLPLEESSTTLRMERQEESSHRESVEHPSLRK